MSQVIIFTTAGSMDVAQKIATALVEARQAACVNIVPGIRSIYSWKGKTCDEGEWLLVIKSLAENLDAVRSTIRQLHTYDLPEVIAVEAAGGDPEYLAWIAGQCGKLK